MEMSRRNMLRLGLLGGVAAAWGVYYVSSGGSVLQSVRKGKLEFLTGLDFETYEPTVNVGGKELDTVNMWYNYTTPGDLATWSGGMASNALSFKPFVGSRASFVSATLVKGKYVNTLNPKLEVVLLGGKTYIKECPERLFDKSFPRYFFVNIPLDEQSYHETVRKQASKVGKGDIPSLFLTQALGESLIMHRKKKNLKFEIDKPRGMSLDKYVGYVSQARTGIKELEVDLPLILGVDASDLYSTNFTPSNRESFFEHATGAMINVDVDWGNEKYTNLDDILAETRKLVENKKMYVRIPISRYIEGEQKFDVMPVKEIRGAMKAVHEKGDGYFLRDAHGMHLYRSTWFAKTYPSLDHDTRKAAIVDLNKKLLGIKSDS